MVCYLSLYWFQRRPLNLLPWYVILPCIGYREGPSTSSHGKLSFLVLVSEKAPQPPPMVCYLSLYWFQRRPLSLLPWYVILHCIGFREGPSTSSHGMLSYNVLVSEKAPQPPPLVCYLSLYWFQRRPLNLLPWYVIFPCIGFREGPSTSSHGTLSFLVLVSEKAPQPPPMVRYLTLYWFQRRPLNLLPWYVILHCIGFREGPSTSSHGTLSYIVLVSEKAPQPPPMVRYLSLYWFQRRPLNLLPWYVILHCIGFREGPSTSSHGMLSYIVLVSEKAPQPPPMVCYLSLYWFQRRPLNLRPWYVILHCIGFREGPSTSSHGTLFVLVLVSEKAPQPPPMVCYLTLYWFQRRPLNLLPWYVILHCIGFREGPSTSSHGMLSYIVLVSEKAPQPPPMVRYLSLYWFQRRPLNLLPWYVILHCIGFREGPSTSSHGMLSYIVLVSEKAPQPPPMVCYLTLYWFRRRPLNLLPWYVIFPCIGFREGPSTSSHGMLFVLVLVSEKAPQPPPMVCYLSLYWFQRRPLNLLPWYVILHCIGFREGPSTSSHGTLSYIVLVSEKALQPPPMVCYLTLYWFQRRPLNLLPWYVILHCIGFREGPSTSSHGMLSYIVLVSEKAPQPPPMVCYLSLYWFQRRPLNLLPWYVILPCIGFREGP